MVDGLLVVSPPPSPRHQGVAAALIRQLDRQNPGGWHVLHELAFRVGDDGRVPDVTVVPTAAHVLGDVPLEPEHFGLVVEVVSPSSRKTDRFAKPGEYAEVGIPLYWRVETAPALLLVAYRLRSGTYDEVAAVDRVGAVSVPWGRRRSTSTSFAVPADLPFQLGDICSSSRTDAPGVSAGPRFCRTPLPEWRSGRGKR